MALTRLHLRKVRWNKPRKANAKKRRGVRRAGENWKYTGLRPLRSKMWITTPRDYPTFLRDFFRMEKALERGEAVKPSKRVSFIRLVKIKPQE